MAAEGDRINEHDKKMSEYAEQLRCWLGQAYHWQCMPYMISPSLMSGRYANLQNSPLSTSSSASGSSQTTQLPTGNNPTPNVSNNGQRQAAQPLAGRIYEIPKLTKRLLAEAIDFGLLFFIKALVTITILDAWSLEEIGLLETENNNEEYDYELAMNFTANLLTIELVHRILVVLYEVYFAYQGGTPGKRTMGLKILYCNRCLPVGENTVLVEPGTDITFWRSLSRAFLKNMGTAILFPTFLPFMVVQHNRTLYDILCGTVVVENP